MSDTLDAALEALRREQFYGAMAEAERALRQQQGEWALYTADAFLRFRPSTVFVVPLTQVELLRAVATERCGAPIGNVGPVVGAQLQDVLAMIVGMP
jgi:hypothetical protein